MELTGIVVLLLSLQLSATIAIGCPQNYSEYSGHCYRISSHKNDWIQARQTCQSEGGDLVSVNSKGEDTFLKELIGNASHYYWIGMLYTDGNYEWLDGTKVGYTAWAKGEPNCMKDSPCQAGYSYYDDLQWEDYNDHFGYYICEMVPSTTPTPKPTVPSKVDCPPNYWEYAGHCYSASSQQTNWTEARRTCQSEGGDLVSVNDQGEDDFLKGEIRNSSRYYWIGMLFTNNSYQWLDGTMVGYTDWADGEPDCMDDSSYVCNAGYSSYHDYQWEDYNDQLGYFICEMVPTTPVPSKTDLHAAIHLECLHHGWYVTVDLNKLSRHPSDISEIYMNKESCTGTLHGSLLVFNKTYQGCNTQAQVVNKTMTFNNYLVYATRDANNVITDLTWKEDLHCSHGYHDSSTINIKPDINEHGSTSGQISGSLVDIKLYTDSAFSQPLQGTVKLGTPVYVQVLSLGHPDVAMVVNSCEAHLKTSSSQIQKPRPLIQDHCSVEPSTTIIATRNQVTRFRFDMFDLPNDDDGIYVTCNVVFCDPMDFSSQCEQTCKTSSTLVG